MAIKVVSNNVRKNFQVTCPTCGAEIQYADSDIRYYRNFLEGYIVCPKCHCNIAQVTEENDTSYRGPLSYRHLRIAAWVLFVHGQIAFLLTFAG